MHVRVFLSVVESVGDDLLAVAVREEVDRARWDDTDESGHETLKQRAWGLVSRYIPNSIFFYMRDAQYENPATKGEGELEIEMEGGRNRMIWVVSTKCHRNPPGLRTSTTLSPTTAPTLACF